MPPNRFESEVESFLEGSHGDRTHIKRADHPRLHHYAGRYSSSETAIAFTGEKRVFLARFSGAEVLSVSTVAVQGRAVVMAVSQLPSAAPCARKSSPCAA